MNFIVKGASDNPTNLMRRAGYRFQRHVADADGKMSFVRELGQNGYPRFHAYVRPIRFDLEVSIHIDHKKHTYGDETRHHGEYSNDGALGPEIERLQQCLR